MTQRQKIGGVCVITPSIADDSELLEKCDAALDGGATLLQYRDKTAPAATRRRRTVLLAALCKKKQTPLIINDSIDLAAQCHAAGVHLGRDDGDITMARKRLGRNALIGATCHNDLAQARSATAAGADYCAFGALFTSATKPQAPRCSVATIRQARILNVAAIVAIGGITAKNAAVAAAAGADAVAVIAAVFNAAEIEKSTREIVAAFAEGMEKFKEKKVHADWDKMA